MNCEARMTVPTLVMVIVVLGVSLGATAYAQPVVVEPGWVLTRDIDVTTPYGGAYNPIDGRLYYGRIGPSAPYRGLYRIEHDDTITHVWCCADVHGVVCDPDDGDVFAAKCGNPDWAVGQIYRTPWNSSAAYVWVSGFHDGDDDPVGLAIAPDDYDGVLRDEGLLDQGEALVTDIGSGGPDEVWGWRPDSAEGEWIVHADNGTLVDASDITIGREHVYLVDLGPDRLYRLGSGGALTEIPIVGDTLYAPVGIALDPLTQDLFILDESRVLRVVVSEAPLSGLATTVITDLHWHNCRTGIDVSPDGSLLMVTNYGANKIYVFTYNPESPRLTLEPDETCYNVGETVTVELWMRNIAELIRGGQFFLEYDDSKLTLVDVGPGDDPFTMQVYECSEVYQTPDSECVPTSGLIDYAVGVPFGGTPTSGDAKMAVLTFTALQQICDEPDLIVWRSHDPPSRLTDETGQPVTPTLFDLDVVDDQPPEVTGLTVTGGNVDATCEFTVTFSATVTDDCCVNTGDVDVVVSLTTANATLGTPNISKTQTNAKTVTISGDVLVSDLTGCPATVQVTVDAHDCCLNSATQALQTADVNDVTDPEITCPAGIDVNADAGYCYAILDPGTATATDNCDGSPTISWVRSDGKTSLTDPYDSADSPITITWTAEDDCGNTDSCDQIISVSAYNDLVLDIKLSPTVETPLTRCITFELWECPDTIPTEIVSMELTFTSGRFTDTVDVPCGDYACITARDELHTLRRTIDPLPMVGVQWAADFVTPGKDLIGGNLNDDYWIDILDFGVFVSQWNANYGTGDTTCSTAFPHADVSGNGTVGTEDFTFIQINFLLSHEGNCCGQPSLGEGDGPVTAISVEELDAMGLSQLAAGDLTGDGWLDAADIAAFLAGVRPKPPLQPVEPVGELEKLGTPPATPTRPERR